VEHPRTKAQSGFSLIEVLVTLAILAIVTKLSMPTYGVWIGNQQIRAGAESIINAVNIARFEAMKRNSRVLFQLTDTVDSSSAWRVCAVARGTNICDPAQPDIQIRDGGEESPSAKVGVATDANTILPAAFGAALPIGGLPGGVLFDGLGRPISAGGFLSLVRIDVRNTNLPAPDERRLVVVVSGGGGARACDPALLAPNARACQ
jgi:type IV fimbrial biogenesis protein FimT